jgi:hypothetical protein
MEESSNRWGDIYKHLKSKGFDVYAPSQHIGECTSRYIVVKIIGSSQIGSLSSVSQQYDILMYIPKEEYSQLEDFIASVKQSMKELEPMIMPLYSQTPSFYDDAVKGHMVSIQYRNSRKV